MRFVLTGSGSGGHFYPLIAIAEALTAGARERKLLPPEVFLLGPEPYDAGALSTSGVSFRRVPAGKLRRYFSLRNITDALKTVLGFFTALWKLFVLYPDAVMSKGSYTSVPVILAAALLRIPIVIHESDIRPGRANWLAARFARSIAISWQESAPNFPPEKTVRTGIPLRSRLLQPAPANPRETLGFKTDNQPLILILGGSQGAERINGLITASLDELLPQYAVLHQTGEQHERPVREAADALIKDKTFLERYSVRGFLSVDALAAALSSAALIVSRAGSGAIAECALFGKPAILIPIPEDISHDQRENAYAYARTGAAVVMEEQNLTPSLLAAQIARILGDRALVAKMQQAAAAFAPRDAAEKIATLLIDIGYEHEG